MSFAKNWKLNDDIQMWGLFKMKPIHGTASEYRPLQVITWLFVWLTCSQPQAVQQDRHFRANGDSETWLNGSRVSVNCWCWHPRTLESPSVYSAVLIPYGAYALPWRENILVCPRGPLLCCMILHLFQQQHSKFFLEGIHWMMQQWDTCLSTSGYYF